MSYTGNNPRIITQQYRPQSSDPANPVEGMIFRADGTSRSIGLWEYKSGSWQPLGASTGGLDIAFQLFGNENLSTWSNGNNASFLGGGSLAGTLAYITSGQLNGDRSYQYTQAAGSLNDYLASPVQSIPLKFRGNNATFYFNYNYNGNSTDIEAVVYDVTNAALISLPANSLIPISSSTSSLYKMNVNIPSTCEEIRIGFQVKVVNSGKILNFDDLVLSADVTQYADPSTVTEWQSYTPTFTGLGTVTNNSFLWRRVGDSIEINGSVTSGTSAAALFSFSLPSGYTLNTAKIGKSNTTAAAGVMVGEYAQDTTANLAGYIVSALGTSTTLLYAGSSINGVAKLTPQNGSSIFGSSANISFKTRVPVAGLSASNPQIIAASDSFSSDTAQFVYAGSATYTLATLPNAPVGTFITWTYASSSNTATQTNAAAPSQSVSDMNVNGVRLFTRAYNAASTSGNPARIAINIGRNFKGKSLDIYKAVAKATQGSLDFWGYNTTAAYGAMIKDYNESTGILLLDAGFNDTSSNTSRAFYFSDFTTQTDGYVVINASKSPALVGVPQVQPRIATLKDLKAASTNGGTFTSGAWRTRELNTLVDNTGIVTNLASNQFILPAGEYYIEASAPGFDVDGHQAKLYNITDAADVILGSSEFSDSGGSHPPTNSLVKGTFIISSAKTFELQHRCATTSTANNGFGRGVTFGSNIYTQVSLTKIK